MTVADFLKITEADDYFIVNISNEKGKVFFGYNNQITEKVGKMKIESIYIDWASEALGIDVIE